MKIKIRDTIYDSENELIMVIFSDKDKENISNMALDATKYCCFPDNKYPTWFIEKWMKEDISINEKNDDIKERFFE